MNDLSTITLTLTLIAVLLNVPGAVVATLHILQQVLKNEKKAKKPS